MTELDGNVNRRDAGPRALARLCIAAGIATMGMIGAPVFGAESSPPPPVQISGLVSGAFGYLTQAGTSDFGDRPSTFSTASEGRLNFSFGSETVSGFIGIWRKYLDNQLSTPNKDLFQLTWTPVPALRMDVGRLAYLEWNVRAVDFHNYAGWSPVVNGFDYIGYTENTDGADLAYVFGKGTEAGLAIFTGNTRIFLDPQYSTNGHLREFPAQPAAGPDGSVGTTAPSVDNSTVYAPHVMITIPPTAWRVAYFSEQVETGEDWHHTRSFTNDALFFSFKWFIGDAGARIDLDLTSAHYEQNRTDVWSPALSITVPVPAPHLLWLEYNPAVYDPEDGKRTEIEYVALGYTIAIANAAVLQPRFKREARRGALDSTVEVFEFALLQRF